MSTDEFSQRIQAIIASAAALKEQASQTTSMEYELFQATLNELYTALEELQVAEEELHQQTEELARARQIAEMERYRYKDLFESAPFAYFVTDEYGTIQQLNRAASALLRIEQSNLLGKSLVVYIAPEDRRTFRRNLNSLAESDHAQEWRVRLQLRDKTLIHAAVSVAIVRDGDDTPTILRWLIHDITEQQEYQEQLRELNAELEDRVAERTSQLKEAVHARDEFLSIAAHELRTPVTSLRGFAQLLLRQLDKAALDPNVLRQYLQIMDQQSIKLTKLVSQLLDISRLDSGRLITEPQLADLATLVRGVVENLRKTATNHTITLSAPPSLVTVVDPIRMEQVIINLLDNAVKYSPDGGAIDVSLTSTDDQTLSLTITDQGIGIPPEQRDRIFERFYQAHHGRNMSGVGLGLYISRQIVELHGGQLSAAFPPEGGTRFTVKLPVNRPNTSLHATTE